MANICFNASNAPFHRLPPEHIADFFNKQLQPSCLARGCSMDFFLQNFTFKRFKELHREKQFQTVLLVAFNLYVMH